MEDYFQSNEKKMRLIINKINLIQNGKFYYTGQILKRINEKNEFLGFYKILNMTVHTYRNDKKRKYISVRI